MENCYKCRNIITKENEGDNYEDIYFICKFCLYDIEIKKEWEGDKERYSFIDYGYE